ncbi:hypothetical protein THAOC_29455 [Thalassiosira oceanica]|uniref:B30.2/SPRY domain-containing protein n=1 Tax=Thalassiosira oceanica TaxID=159749 RepID=K0RDS5_THAOC|nr:hypothetical protein THAOC_29455 [Thalassiosira oceanica]|eukprot:EJK51375.1 hypothetical protein THAOC_29455 [Thalassiosira oceanica]
MTYTTLTAENRAERSEPRTRRNTHASAPAVELNRKAHFQWKNHDDHGYRNRKLLTRPPNPVARATTLAVLRALEQEKVWHPFEVNSTLPATLSLVFMFKQFPVRGRSPRRPHRALLGRLGHVNSRSCPGFRPQALRFEHAREDAKTRRRRRSLQQRLQHDPSLSTMQPRVSKRARLLPSDALGALDDDLLARCASYLDVDGLAQLGRTSARFGIPQAGEQRSLVNEAARRRFVQSATDDEKGCLPKHDDESDVGLCRALELLRQPLCFDELVGDGFRPQESPASVRYVSDDFVSTAMSGHVMRGGRHFAEFTINQPDERLVPLVHLGVIRPVSLTDGIDVEADWRGHVNPVRVSSSSKPALSEKLRSQRTAKWEDSNVHCCTYYGGNGKCHWTDWANCPEWQASEELRESGTIGLLLDLDEGTLSAFKNGRRLGVMKDGLGGEYCWFVAVWSECTISMSRGNAPN